MKLVIAVLLLMILAACAAPRALVKDCRYMGGDIHECEIIKKL